MIGKIADIDLLTEYAVRLRRKHFRPGFDHMDPSALLLWLKVNGAELSDKLRDGRYRPMPALGFFTAKRSGGYRELARLTALDSVIQSNMLAIIGEYCENFFSPDSYAFRPGKGMGQALARFCERCGQYAYAVKLDPKNCYDRIDHSVLLAAAERLIGEKAVTALIGEMIRMPLLTEGEVHERNMGLIQGAPLSPLLMNLYFDGLDHMLEAENIPFIRYADDIVAFSDSRQEAENIGRRIVSFLRGELLLEENVQKTMLAPPWEMQYLGRKFERKDSAVTVRETPAHIGSAFYNWYEEKPANDRRRRDLFEDGILRQKDFSLCFDTENGCTDIPIAATEVINIYSNVVFDSRFLERAMKNGITINLFDSKNELLGHFVPETPLRNSRLTMRQLAEQDDPELRMAMARQFLLASAHNTKLVIRYYNKQRKRPEYAAALRDIALLEKEAGACADTAALLIIEARMREAYYRCYDFFAEGSGFVFDRRSRRPPQNEMNAMLSFGNTILYNLIALEINKTPLDVRTGFLHSSDRRLGSLNLDVAEIFKPLVVDRTVFSLINLKSIRAEHFTAGDDGAVFLNEEGKKLFLDRFYAKLDSTQMIKGVSRSYHQLIREEIYALLRHFKTGEPYRAFRQIR